jgi:hypothetical protein
MTIGKALSTATIFFLVLSSMVFCIKSAEAQEEIWTVSAANWMQYWYFDRARSEFLESRMDSLDNRFIVDFNLGDFYTGAWLHTLQMDRPDASSGEITQRYFGWRDRGLAVHIGNFYHVFDRGLTLNAFLDDAVYYDNNLDGVKITGLYDHFEFDAISARGLNKRTEEREYIIRGVRSAIRPLDPFKFGFSYVRFKQNDMMDFNRSFNMNITAISSGIIYGPADISAEYAVKRGRDDVMPGVDGDGIYLSGSMSFDLFSVYAEYKNYINLIYPDPGNAFNNPPPVNHQGRTLIDQIGVPGERGYQIGGLFSPSFDLNFDLSYSESSSRDAPVDYHLKETYIGLRWSSISNLVINYSWDRIGYTLEDEVENYFDAYYYLGSNHTASITAYTKRFMQSPGEDYHEDYLTLGYGMGNTLQLNIGGSLSSNELSIDPEKLAFVELKLRFRSHELVIFNGGERGGMICSSGICQTRPTFQGTRVVLFSRF